MVFQMNINMLMDLASILVVVILNRRTIKLRTAIANNRNQKKKDLT